jgi:hypothetical protein
MKIKIALYLQIQILLTLFLLANVTSINNMHLLKILIEIISIAGAAFCAIQLFINKTGD